MDLKKQRGQFFTTNHKVLDVLISLIYNDGDIFEPSAGSGHIIKSIEDKNNKIVYGCEIDCDKVTEKVCKSEIDVENFFNYIKKDKRYSTVIGNPPFVKLKNVEKDTTDILPEKINGNGNLYYFFIKYSVEVLEDNGELIFIVPKEWLYNTSSQFLRDYLKLKGSFTHFIDCGEEKLFDDADVPALCVFRFQKNYYGTTKYFESINDYQKNQSTDKKTIFDKTVKFTNDDDLVGKISDFFDIKVGLVTGKEEIFKINENHNFEGECVIHMTTTSKSYEQYLFLEDYCNIDNMPQNTKNYILENKEVLISRKIKKFNETNFWKYGAIRNIDLMRSDRPRIYGLLKTRDENPFWVGDSNSYFSGGVFALFLKDEINLNIDEVVHYLNSDRFKKIMKESNMYSNNKVSITPTAFSSLSFSL